MRNIVSSIKCKRNARVKVHSEEKAKFKAELSECAEASIRNCAEELREYLPEVVSACLFLEPFHAELKEGKTLDDLNLTKAKERRYLKAAEFLRRYVGRIKPALRSLSEIYKRYDSDVIYINKSVSEPVYLTQLEIISGFTSKRIKNETTFKGVRYMHENITVALALEGYSKATENLISTLEEITKAARAAILEPNDDAPKLATEMKQRARSAAREIMALYEDKSDRLDVALDNLFAFLDEIDGLLDAE